MPRFTWTVEGDDPDYAHAESFGITGFYSPTPSKDALSTRVINDTLNRGRIAGIYYGAGWWDIPGKQLAEKINADYMKFPLASRKKIRVMFNEERHDPALVLELLQRWRELQPTANTSWSMEPNQGGWMGADVTKGGASPSGFVQWLLKLKVRIVPQLFLQGMTPTDEDKTMWDIACRGIPANVISPFYDAALLRQVPDWDGFAFTEGRLPRP